MLHGDIISPCPLAGEGGTIGFMMVGEGKREDMLNMIFYTLINRAAV